MVIGSLEVVYKVVSLHMTYCTRAGGQHLGGGIHSSARIYTVRGIDATGETGSMAFSQRSIYISKQYESDTAWL